MKTTSLFRVVGVSLVLAISAPLARAAVQAAYYVDPVSGSDSNNGTSPGTAFATLTRARDAVRTISSSMTGDIVVNLMAGDHLVTAPINLNDSDRGTNGFFVIWTSYGIRGSARIIGGVKATGWTLDSGNVYKASFTLAAPRLQAVFENGVRGLHARHPNSGYWTINAKDATFPKKKFQWKSANAMPNVAIRTDLQVFVWPGSHDWSTEIRDVASIDYTNRWITLTMDIQQPYLDDLAAGSRYFVQGCRELVDQPGEFYHDRTANMLYYYPRNTPIASQEIIVPKTTTIFNLVGSGTLQNVAFTNLKFIGTNLDSENYTGSAQGMIYCENASNILIQNNEFANVGGTAVNVEGSGVAHDVTVVGNHITDAGVGGITVLNASNCLVSNNRVHNTAQVFADSGSNVRFTTVDDSEISYNLLSESKRHGIRMRLSNNNTIKFNEVYRSNTDSQDTGSIYFGYSDFNVFDNNRAHDSGDFGQQQHGMYVEDGSDNNTITNNILYEIGNAVSNTATAPINVKGIANLIQNNVFDYTRSHSALRTHEIGSNAQARNEDILRNIMYASGTAATTLYWFQSYEDDRIRSSNFNTFYKSAAGSYVMHNIPGTDTLSNWKTLQGSKYDQNSVTADPLFVDGANHNYTLQAGSPALGLGFVQIPQKTIGLRPDFVYPETRGQWIFSGSTVDVSSNGNNGTKIGGSYVADWSGVASSALSLNGTSDYVNIPDNDMLDFGPAATAFSIVAWVKSSATAIGGIVSKSRDTGTPNMDYRFRMMANGTVDLTRYHQSSGVTESVNTTATINNGQWHHVAFVNENASSHKIYIDGTLSVTSTTTWTKNTTNSEPVRIGRDKNGPSIDYFFNGQLDDVAILRRALSANEIKDLNHLPHP